MRTPKQVTGHVTSHVTSRYTRSQSSAIFILIVSWVKENLVYIAEEVHQLGRVLQKLKSDVRKYVNSMHFSPSPAETDRTQCSVFE